MARATGRVAGCRAAPQKRSKSTQKKNGTACSPKSRAKLKPESPHGAKSKHTKRTKPAKDMTRKRPMPKSTVPQRRRSAARLEPIRQDPRGQRTHHQEGPPLGAKGSRTHQCERECQSAQSKSRGPKKNKSERPMETPTGKDSSQ